MSPMKKLEESKRKVIIENSMKSQLDGEVYRPMMMTLLSKKQKKKKNGDVLSATFKHSSEHKEKLTVTFNYSGN